MKDKTVIELPPIERAISIFGTDLEFAERLGGREPGTNISSQAIGKWKRGQVPAERCIDIEELTRKEGEEGEEVTRYELRPDVFGDKPE